MKTVKLTEEAWKALTILKAQLGLRTYSEAIISVIHTAITNIYEETDLHDDPRIRELEKAINWKRPLED